MKKYFAFALAFLFIASAGIAQQKHPLKNERSEMFRGLDLTVEQKEKMKSIRESSHASMEKLRAEKLTADQFAAKRKAIREDEKKQIEGILTPEQKQKMQTRLSQIKGKELNGKEGMNMKGKYASLNLTDKQKADLQANRKDFKEKSLAIKNNAALTDEQKREDLKKLKEQKKESMKTILTPEQQKKVSTFRKNHGNQKGKH